MSSMSISLPDKMRGFIKSRVQSGEYHNESEYIRDLIRRDSERLSDEQKLRDLLRSSEESGVSDRQIPDIIRDVKKGLKPGGGL